jgi:hypothetical protein
LIRALTGCRLHAGDDHPKLGQFADLFPLKMPPLSTGKPPIFDLTGAVEAASCRPAARQWRQFL